MFLSSREWDKVDCIGKLTMFKHSTIMPAFFYEMNKYFKNTIFHRPRMSSQSFILQNNCSLKRKRDAWTSSSQTVC